MTPAIISQMIGLSLWVTALALIFSQLGKQKQWTSSTQVMAIIFTFPLAFVLRGLLGDISPMFPALLAFMFLTKPISLKQRYFLVTFIVTSLCLQASALGLFSLDLYGAGYSSTLFLGLLAAVMIVSFHVMPYMGWACLFGLVLNSLQFHPSPNIWDAVVDLPSTVLAIWLVIRNHRPVKQLAQ